MERLLQDSTTADVEFNIEGTLDVLYAHSIILRTQCSYFRAMFGHDFLEGISIDQQKLASILSSGKDNKTSGYVLDKATSRKIVCVTDFDT